MSKHKGLLKRVGLTLLLISALALTGCYINEDPQGGDVNVGSDNSPFGTTQPLPTDTPLPTDSPTNNNQVGQGAQVNWEDDWNASFSTNAPTNVPTPPTATATPPPVAITTSTPTSTPAQATDGLSVITDVVLKSGSKGTAVKQMQQRLKELDYLSGTADGEFGSATTKAVRDFQANNGIGVDGVAGKTTLTTLYSDNAKAMTSTSKTAPPAGSPTPKPTAKPTATPNWSNVRYLELGSSGTDVKKLQNRLIELGYLGGKADGDFDIATDTALRAFQKKAGIDQDGVAGPATQKKLYASNAAKASSAAAKVGEALAEGAKGSTVKEVQQTLKDLQYYTGSVDGSFGSGTTDAVKAFQKNNGLTVDGKVGQKTLDKLNSGNAVKASSSGTTTDGYTTLREGDEGAAVKKLQQALKKLSYYSGTVDGKYGSGTVAAVTSFQKLNKITADGIAGPTTQRLLDGGSATANGDYDTLREYDEGTAVKNLQYALYELGYYQGKRNGIYNDDTVNAVREFQMNNGLKVDGVAGEDTQKLVNSNKAKPASATGSDTEYDTLRKGDSGNSVIELQDALYQKGYMTVSQINGSYDSTTVDAVKEFQRINGIAVDGAAGNETQQLLFSSAGRKKP